ncbi:MAG: hypothetical protein NTY14_04110, partial [Candidatus Omnitrophica bacterium]|nr:hypothetical protein [Candidatus Omnitrophota bacterium]
IKRKGISKGNCRDDLLSRHGFMLYFGDEYKLGGVDLTMIGKDVCCVNVGKDQTIGLQGVYNSGEGIEVTARWMDVVCKRYDEFMEKGIFKSAIFAVIKEIEDNSSSNLRDGGNFQEALEKLNRMGIFKGNLFESRESGFINKIERMTSFIPFDLTLEYRQGLVKTNPRILFAIPDMLSLPIVPMLVQEALYNSWDAIRTYYEEDYFKIAKQEIRKEDYLLNKHIIDGLEKRIIAKPTGYIGGDIRANFKISRKNKIDILDIVISDNGAGYFSADSQRKREIPIYIGGKHKAVFLTYAVLANSRLANPFLYKRENEITTVTVSFPLDSLEPRLDGGSFTEGLVKGFEKSGLSLEQGLRGLKIIRENERLLLSEEVFDWRRGGAETFLASVRIVLENDKGQQYSRQFLAKAVIKMFPDKVAQEWLKRKEILDRLGIKTQEVFAHQQGEGVLYVSWLPFTGMEAFSAATGEHKTDLIKKLASIAARLDVAGFAARDFLHDLVSDGDELYYMDFGSDLGEPSWQQTITSKEKLLTFLKSDSDRTVAQEQYQLVLEEARALKVKAELMSLFAQDRAKVPGGTISMVTPKGGKWGGLHPKLNKRLIERLKEFYEVVEGGKWQTDIENIIRRWGDSAFKYDIDAFSKNPAYSQDFIEEGRQVLKARDGKAFPAWFVKARKICPTESENSKLHKFHV